MAVESLRNLTSIIGNKMADFRKYLLISVASGRTSGDNWRLDRISWSEVSKIENLADYDGIVVNLTALGQLSPLKVFSAEECRIPFDRKAWMHILGSGGQIWVVGDPLTRWRIPPNAGGGAIPRGSIRRAVNPPPERASDLADTPFTLMISLVVDGRPFDYRRVDRPSEAEFPQIYHYLDQVTDWTYSFRNAEITGAIQTAMAQAGMSLRKVCFGKTSYESFLAIQWEVSRGQVHGRLALVPSLGKMADEEDAFVLRDFMGVSTNLPPPQWSVAMRLPDQSSVEGDIDAKRSQQTALSLQIREAEHRLLHVIRWRRLLFDDGPALETIVQEAFEQLGANMAKTSPEKDDFRLVVQGYPEGIVEVKGTHNEKFNVGSLRQLSGWMDEALVAGTESIKGVFVGNAARLDAPSARRLHLFEPNNLKFAELKSMIVLRTVDLYCLTILSLIGSLNLSALWKHFFATAGSFDATIYWQQLPQEYGIDASAAHSDEAESNPTPYEGAIS